ncbi:mechanosensitive ion channel protein MscS [Aeromicrobium sp. PE09-221]|uniref:mechanosensitive ion channel family protein n=1 Tax=Aeromicrobium sp. PE09-221 TaxID=1898043 RepID=UPI000B3EB4A7|nr:mechanosensitive ion channel family protein [Aeromicrobium sp. PE09-221]OUZ11691.1 mechanosensitive ion channel protein MscS [Aeromicrobium sp. PE09-221]
MPDLDFLDEPWFHRFVEVPLRAIIIIAFALVLRWVANRLIDRLISQAAKGAMPNAIAQTKAGAKIAERGEPAAQRRRQRAEATGSLLKSVATGIILTIAVVTILASFGIPVAPLLTSAGIVGVALGFGAQTLVKDFLAGISMMLEDQYGVGDVVDLGEAAGTVESVGLRVTRLRDVDGTVWYVRNGEILRVGNSSQNWARTVLDITVAYESDLDEAQRILHDVANEMYAEKAFEGVILEPPEVWGVERFDKDGVVIRVVLKTAPLEQWGVARAMRQRVKHRFDAAGIRIPVTMVPPGGY